MNATAPAPSDTDRAERIERIAADLLPSASSLTRVLLRRAGDGISRAEGGVLRTLDEGPQRITALADLEGLAQPTMTVLVKRLEERGWTERRRDPDDGRVALISLTRAGEQALAQLRADYRGALASHLESLDEVELAELDAATSVIRRLLRDLQLEATA